MAGLTSDHPIFGGKLKTPTDAAAEALRDDPDRPARIHWKGGKLVPVRSSTSVPLPTRRRDD
jgi:hypothetical protein